MWPVDGPSNRVKVVSPGLGGAQLAILSASWDLSLRGISGCSRRQGTSLISGNPRGEEEPKQKPASNVSAFPEAHQGRIRKV